MSDVSTLQDVFEGADRARASRLVAARGVSFKTVGDLSAEAFVRDGSGYRVRVEAPSSERLFLRATCSCTKGKRGRPCPHVSAVIEALADRHPELLGEATQLAFEGAAAAAPSAFQQKQAERKKEYDERRKALSRAKRDARRGREPVEAAPEGPPHVELALKYFETNGFALRADLSATVLAEAKRTLARVFHPDRGGSHSEMLELNKHFETLEAFIEGRA